MSDPQAATLTQLRNIEHKTGRTLAALQALVEGSGLAKHGEQRSWLMERLQLGYGDANAVVGAAAKGIVSTGAAAPASAAPATDPLDAIYSGAQQPLRPLHDAVIGLVREFGAFEAAPKKAYVSLRRNKQFAMLGPAAREAIEIGINAKKLPPHPRLKLQPPGAMCQATTRISAPEQVDAALAGWLKLAYDAAA